MGRLGGIGLQAGSVLMFCALSALGLWMITGVADRLQPWAIASAVYVMGFVLVLAVEEGKGPVLGRIREGLAGVAGFGVWLMWAVLLAVAVGTVPLWRGFL